MTWAGPCLVFSESNASPSSHCRVRRPEKSCACDIDYYLGETASLVPHEDTLENDARFSSLGF